MFNRLPETVIEYGQIAHIICTKGGLDEKATERAVTEH